MIRSASDGDPLRRPWCLVVLLASTLSACTILLPSTGDGGSVECLSDAECPAGRPQCRAGACVAPCEGVTCAPGMRCERATGACIDYLGPACSGPEACPEEAPLCEGGRCRVPRQGRCERIPCAAGLECLVVRGEERCLARCDAGACRVDERCLDSSYGPLAGVCAPNLCRPGGGPADRLIRAAPYGGACATEGGNEGVCVGPLVDA
ncbi:MAG: hypothetical protein D6729_18275, partial [Deltaproteobacteria bacterium]